MGRVITDNVSQISLSIKRFMARLVDLAIYSLVSFFIRFTVMYLQSIDTVWMILIINSPIIIMLFLEPLLLSIGGTTLGKYLMGISVFTFNKRKLTYQEGLIRVGKLIFLWVVGLYLPYFIVFSFVPGGSYAPNILEVLMAVYFLGFILVFGIVSFIKVKNEQALFWESGSMLVVNKRRWWMYGLSILCITLSLWGKFTMQNNIMSTNYSPKAQLLENYKTNLSGYQIENAPELDIEQKDGVITQVSFTLEEKGSTDSKLLNSYNYNHVAICALKAYVGIQEEITYSDATDHEIMNLGGHSVLDSSFEFELEGIKIHAEIEKTGYDDKSSIIKLIPLEGEKQFYRLRFVMTRT